MLCDNFINWIKKVLKYFGICFQTYYFNEDLCFNLKDNSQKVGEIKKERHTDIHWFSPQVVVTARSGSMESQEALRHILLFSQQRVNQKWSNHNLKQCQDVMPSYDTEARSTILFWTSSHLNNSEPAPLITILNLCKRRKNNFDRKMMQC